jgi:transcriptional regulator with PAS, ATPase and Fis domain
MAGTSGGREEADNAGKEGGAPDMSKSLQDMRKAHIEDVIDLAGGDLDKAAEFLKISRSDLRRWMTKLGIR